MISSVDAVHASDDANILHTENTKVTKSLVVFHFNEQRLFHVFHWLFIFWFQSLAFASLLPFFQSFILGDFVTAICVRENKEATWIVVSYLVVSFCVALSSAENSSPFFSLTNLYVQMRFDWHLNHWLFDQLNRSTFKCECNQPQIIITNINIHRNKNWNKTERNWWPHGLTAVKCLTLIKFDWLIDR